MNYIYTMSGVSKTVPPKREIIKDISLSFFPGAKIGLLGLNGSGKSTVLKIMAGIDKDFVGEARPQPGIKVGYLEQEPKLDPERTVRECVEEGLGEIFTAQAELDKVYEAYGDPDADFDALAEKQARLEAILAAGDAHTMEQQFEQAADALRLPPWDAKVSTLSGGEKRRVALCRLLLQRPDMLLLDEPTNHLDAESVEWLELFLARFPGTVVAVTHDRYFLDQVATGLLAFPPGGGTGQNWELRVEDNGPGVPPDLRERIFKPYFTTKREGTGIGLALAQQIIRAHGGGLRLLASSHEDTRNEKPSSMAHSGVETNGLEHREGRETHGGAVFSAWMPIGPIEGSSTEVATVGHAEVASGQNSRH